MPLDQERFDRIAEYLAQPDHADQSDKEVATALGIPNFAVARARKALGKPKMIQLAINQITIDPRLQLRADLDRLKIDEYAELLQDGRVLPPSTVFHSDDRYLLVDGFQRTAAHIRVGLTEVTVEVKPGGFREALLFACGANANHGLDRSPADKRNAVRTMLADPEWSKLNNNKIAEACQVSHVFVSKMRKQAESEIAESTQVDSEPPIGNVSNAQSSPAPFDDPSPELEPLDDTRTPLEQYADELADEPLIEPPINTLSPRKLSNDEYLIGLEVRSHLSDQCRLIFDHDALLHRTLTSHETFKAFADLVNHHINPPKGVQMGSYARQFRRILTMLSPAHWMFCSTCNGTGFDQTANCGKCYGKGYLIRSA